MMSLKEFILDGVNLVLVSTAGYASNKPSGTFIYNFSVKAVNEHARFPPAESPVTYILFGLIFIYLLICCDMKL